MDYQTTDELSVASTLEELTIVLKDLPPNKAVGPSKMHYEDYKYLGKFGKQILFIFYCKCLTLGLTPQAWNQAPIPKSTDWEDR